MNYLRNIEDPTETNVGNRNKAPLIHAVPLNATSSANLTSSGLELKETSSEGDGNSSVIKLVPKNELTPYDPPYPRVDVYAPRFMERILVKDDEAMDAVANAVLDGRELPDGWIVQHRIQYGEPWPMNTPASENRQTNGDIERKYCPNRYFHWYIKSRAPRIQILNQGQHKRPIDVWYSTIEDIRISDDDSQRVVIDCNPRKTPTSLKRVEIQCRRRADQIVAAIENRSLRTVEPNDEVLFAKAVFGQANAPTRAKVVAYMTGEHFKSVSDSLRGRTVEEHVADESMGSYEYSIDAGTTTMTSEAASA